MREEFLRSEMLLGENNMQKLASCRVAVFGLGGVGGYAAEALARGGVGGLTFVDGDRVSVSNINRQIVALTNTVGAFKAELAAERARLINPAADVCARVEFFNAQTESGFDFTEYDYVVDAIDVVTDKLLLIRRCKEAGTPVISCMGTGAKLDPAAFRVADISKTSVCPLARTMRRELKKLGITSLKAVYSEEQPSGGTLDESGRHAPGSVSFVPPVAGFIMAGEVIKDLIKL